MRLQFVSGVAEELKYFINEIVFRDCPPWKVCIITTGTVLTTSWLYYQLKADESVAVRLKQFFFNNVKKIPFIRRGIETQLKVAERQFEGQFMKECNDLEFRFELPQKGKSAEVVRQLVRTHLDVNTYKWKDGRVSGAVYSYNPDLIELVTQVYGMASFTNPLHADIFPGICKMESEVVKMVCNLFNGGDESCGTMTTGGTESILMAMKAYRDYAREIKGITRPNIVAPRTAHAAFDKAGQYFNIYVRYVEVDPETYEVDIKKFERAINSNTIALIGSAPNFPYGTMDDIYAIAKIGVKYDIPVHVDACLGSFVIALMGDAGFYVPEFTFSIDGVTSISVDTHKYGFAPKGSSVIIYAEKKYKEYQYTITTDWPGGIYGSPTMNGSRAGGIIAACWATMIYIGRQRYTDTVQRILTVARYIETELRKIDSIFIFGKPVTTVIAIGSKTFEIFRLSDALNKRGWCLNTLQFPSGVHICVTDIHTQAGVADQFLADVRACVAKIMEDPKRPTEGRLALYGTAQNISDRSIITEVTRLFINSMYITQPPRNQMVLKQTNSASPHRST